MQVIQHQELASSQASITFSSIPQTYTDLVLVWSTRTSRTGDINADIALRFNGSTSGYNLRSLLGTGSSAVSRTNPVGTTGINDVLAPASSTTANTFGSGMAYIPNYTSSTAKSVSIDVTNENNATSNYTQIIAGTWSGTDPITSVSLTDLNSANFVQYSSATLYGVLKGSDGIVTVS